MRAGEGSLRTKRQAKKTRDKDNRRQASRRREEHRSARHPCSTAVARTTARAPRDASVRARARQLTVTVGRRRSMAARRILTAERRTTTRAMRRVGTAGQRYVGNADRSHDRQLETNVSAQLRLAGARPRTREVKQKNVHDGGAGRSGGGASSRAGRSRARPKTSRSGACRSTQPLFHGIMLMAVAMAAV